MKTGKSKLRGIVDLISALASFRIAVGRRLAEQQVVDTTKPYRMSMI
jgi:hypothetical protein